MKATSARFMKGQTVYAISTNFCSDDDRKICFGIVHKRIVDACGKKQVTFFNRGNDEVFGRSIRFREDEIINSKMWFASNMVFENPESAFEELKRYKEMCRKNYDYRIHEEVLSDDMDIRATAKTIIKNA